MEVNFYLVTKCLKFIFLDGKFPEFSYSKIRILVDFNLLTLWPFAVSFLNGGSTGKQKKTLFMYGLAPRIPRAICTRGTIEGDALSH